MFARNVCKCLNGSLYFINVPCDRLSTKRSFSKVKVIKTFHRSTMMDDRLCSLVMLSIERSCAWTLKYDHIDAFTDRKAYRKPFC